MRTIGFRSNVLFIIASAFGLLAALGRPWYAPAPVPTAEEANIGDVQGPVENFFLRLGREFGNDNGTKGWDAFTSTDMILAALAVIAIVTAIGALTPGVEQPAREVLRIVTLAMLGIVVVKLVNTPDHAGLVERRQGRVDVGDRVGDMVQTRAALGDELADRGVGSERAQQLDVSVADVEQHRLDSLRLDRLAMRKLHLEALLI